jgi:23S rRNA (guanosine2251-2'-O)-methyltransferase
MKGISSAKNMRKLENQELNRLNPESFRESPKTPIVVVLDNIRSLHNVGSVFRTSDGFRIEKIWLCGITATPPNKDIRKTALGATETVSWEYASSTLDVIEKLKETHCCLAVEQTADAVPLHEFQPDSDLSYAFVFGHEVNGVSQEVVNACKGALEIPQIGTKHSLNVSVAVGIVLWDVFAKLQTQG